MTIDEIHQYIRNAPQNFNQRNSEPAKQSLSELKQVAIQHTDQKLAKALWCLESIIEIQDKYIDSFLKMKSEQFYEAWCRLEEIEIQLQDLTRHFQSRTDEFHVSFIAKHVYQYQRLFPYKLFYSPEIIELEKTCSICNKPISIRTHCGHHVGEIYDGEVCYRKVTKCEFIGLSIVKNPVQKYSVLFIVDPVTHKQKDQYNYALLQYLIVRIASPFDAWDFTWTKKRQPHSRYKYLGRNDPCPCESGKKYKQCCLTESGVLRPHCEFIFHVTPPTELLTTEWVD